MFRPCRVSLSRLAVVPAKSHVKPSSGMRPLRQLRGLAQNNAGKATYYVQPSCVRGYRTSSQARTVLYPTQTESPAMHPPADTRLYSSQAESASHPASHPAPEPTIHDVFEPDTGTWQFIIADPHTLTAVIVDPVLDYDRTMQVVSTSSADALLSLIQSRGYKISMILETHAHADHITAASYLQHRLAQEQGERPTIGIGKRIGQVQRLFAKRYGVRPDEYEHVFGKLFEDDEEFIVGDLRARAIHLPGHTPDHLGYMIGSNVFCGDSIFHADIGTARCDFPGGSAHDLYQSGRKLLSLPTDIKIWPGHDYPPQGRKNPEPYMTVAQHRAKNKHLKNDTGEGEFVAMRLERDRALAAPRYLHQALQMNIRAGRLPAKTEEGLRMLTLPMNLEGKEW